MIYSKQLLHYTLKTQFPDLVPYLEHFTEDELLNLSPDYFQMDIELNNLFQQFYESIDLLREIDERIQNLILLKQESSRYQCVLRDLQRRLSNDNDT
ncbi:hypothetical protein EBU71_22585 [bacterium]|nr:hypothetical protein [Candidatus Elulimicrobium humile]